MGTCSMGIDVIYLCRCNLGLFHGKLHCLRCTASVFCRRSNMIGIPCTSVTGHFCVNLCSTRFCMLQLFQHYNSRTFAKYESISVFIKWNGGTKWIGRSRKCCQCCKSGNTKWAYTAFGSSCKHHICVTILDCTECITNTVRSCGAGSYDIAAFSTES